MKKQQSGFTLIELIMVIVILGILSAFALPRFADLSGDAEVASLQGALGSAKSAAAIAHAACLAGATCNANAATSSVTLEGTAVAMVYGYPANTAVCTAGQLGDFDCTVASGAMVVSPSSTDGEPCFTYTEPSGANTAPTFTYASTNSVQADNSCGVTP